MAECNWIECMPRADKVCHIVTWNDLDYIIVVNTEMMHVLE